MTKMHYKIYHFKSLTSTQDKAKEFAKNGLNNVVLVADTQTIGKGRFKRKWHSDKGGLWMSILLKQNDVKNLQYLTFAAAVSVVKSIKKIANLSANIKWPNDVHYRRKKLCGILTEGIFGRTDYVAIGIGLNVNQSNFPEDIKNISISLRIIKNRHFKIKKIMESILNEFYFLYSHYYTKNKLKQIQNIWKKYCDTINKDVTVITHNKKIRGKAVGVDENCSLLLKSKNNEISKNQRFLGHRKSKGFSRVIKIMEGDINVRY